MPSETIAIACDHAGLDLKRALVEDLESWGRDVVDLGTDSEDSVDYPDYADALAEALRQGKAGLGVLVCGTGIGIAIAANRHPHIRAAVVHDALGARLTRQHNNANVICFGGRMIGMEVARDALRTFLETEFEGGRHARRVDKMTRLPAVVEP